jgi:thiamine-monophosphate kinase
MRAHLPLGPGPEFDRIRAFAKALGPAASGWGDDCALIEIDGTTLALTIDASIEGVHFQRAWLKPEEIGWRAGAAALSDLAADGAEPLALLITLGMRGDEEPAVATAVMRGVGEVAASVGATVAGGDLTRSDRMMLDVCAVGRAPRPVRRLGAVGGDGLWVTGILGGPGAALAAWQGGVEPPASARARFARPQPRVAAGKWLRDHGAHAMIDVSDGLAADAAHLAAASGVGLVIALEHLLLLDGVDRAAALASGEEYELLVALPEAFGPRDAKGFWEALQLPLTRIGQVEAGSGVRVTDRGRPVSAPRGYDHFAL